MALLADIPSTGHLGDAQARRFSLDGDNLADQSAAFIDFAAHHIAHGRKVVALYPQWRGGRAERAIQFARGALRTDHIAPAPLDLSPLALSLLADQMAYLAPYLPAGLVAELSGELPGHVLAGGWLRSVANLSTIPITVKQHMGSFAPKVVFLAFCAPLQRVGRVRKANPEPNIPFRPVHPVQTLVCAGKDADRTAFDEQFLPVIGSTSVHDLPEQPLGSAYWGSAKYVEFVVFSAHQDALTRPVRAIRYTTCAWCRERVAGPRCRFCGAANQAPIGRPPAYAKAGQVPAPAQQPQSRPPAPSPGPALDERGQSASPRPAHPSPSRSGPLGYGIGSGANSYPQAPPARSSDLDSRNDTGPVPGHRSTHR